MRLLQTGWLSRNGGETLPALQGWQAELEFFFRYPHRTAVIRLAPPLLAAADVGCHYLICHGCERIHADMTWTIDGLSCRPATDTLIAVEDPARVVRVECYAARIFDREAGSKWVGGGGLTDDPQAVRVSLACSFR